jgi:hypothetical protein
MTNPALVSQRAAQRLPRLALWALCAAYLLPGLFGREPWKSADIVAFGYMANIASGAASWWEPTIAGVASGGAPLPYWLGALSIQALTPWLDAALAARIPFALLLGLALMLTWYATFHLARTDAAQPVAFAFGGEADAVDYARAIADGALLALIASLGLLQLGHETTPELSQLAGVALLLYALAASPYRPWKARAAALVALPVIAASNAPALAAVSGLIGVVLCLRSSYDAVRRFARWLAAGALLAVLLASLEGLWEWRIGAPRDAAEAWSMARLLVWFMWPAWPFALWTLWRWRHQLLNRHIAVPLGIGLVAVIASLAMRGSDRALMLALPPLAVLAAFALPTFARSTAAAIDWFSVFFFSAIALTIWVVYAAMHTGVPAKPAANVMRLAPGFEARFSVLALGAAVLATLAWLALVRWRTARHRDPLWKSLVLPASGVALSWLLLMTLWLPLLDYARGYRALLDRVAAHVPRSACIAGSALPRAHQAALEVLGRWRVDGAHDPSTSPCAFLLVVEPAGAAPAPPEGWSFVARERRPTDRDETTAIYRRSTAPG